jgi:DNA-binding CsgD family transcriptional regulator
VSTRRTAPRGHQQRRPPGEDAKKRDRAARALELRLVGATYRQIAQQLDVSEFAAYYDVQDELGRLDLVTKKRAERLRDLEARRLDRWTQALEPGIRTGDPRAILAAVRLMERRAKLFGLDAPTRTQFTGRSGGAVPIIVRWISAE